MSTYYLRCKLKISSSFYIIPFETQLHFWMISRGNSKHEIQVKWGMNNSFSFARMASLSICAISLIFHSRQLPIFHRSGQRKDISITSSYYYYLRGAWGTCAPPGPNSLNFMQFLGKYGKIVCWHPPGSWHPLLGEIQDPPLLTCTECHQTCSNEPLRMIYISGSSCLLGNEARRYHTDTPCNNSHLNHYVIYKIHNLPKKYVYRKPEALIIILLVNYTDLSQTVSQDSVEFISKM